MWHLLLAVAGATCSDLPGGTRPVTDFDAAVEAAWALATSDQPAEFRAEMAKLQGQLSCLDGPLSATGAAAFHRNRALVSEGAGDREGAVAAVGAALRLAPEKRADWTAASPAWGMLAGSAPGPGAHVEFSVSLAASIYVDGVAATGRPMEHPVVVQAFGADGVPIDGGWVDARTALPEWVTFPAVSCPTPMPSSDLVAAVETAESAFARLDLDGFTKALHTVANGLPCVDGALGPDEAAAIHRLEGMRLFALGAELGALRSLQESRMLDPIYRPTPEVVPPDSSLEQLWTSSGTLASPPWIPMEAPDVLVMRVDGILTRERPATLPSIVQATTPNGRVLWTRYVPALVPLPDLAPYAVRAESEGGLAPPALATYRNDDERRRSGIRDQVLALSGAGLLFGGGLLYTVNARYGSLVHNRHTPHEDLARYARAANTAGTASVAVGGLGLGLLGVAVVFD